VFLKCGSVAAGDACGSSQREIQYMLLVGTARHCVRIVGPNGAEFSGQAVWYDARQHIER
jgi:hypothetical protein